MDKVAITLESPTAEHFKVLLEELQIGQKCYGATIVDILHIHDKVESKGDNYGGES